MEQNIYGVDIEKGAVDIARLRFWLAMVVDAKEPEPLPNLHFKIMQGNSLLETYEGFDLTSLVKPSGDRLDFVWSEAEAQMLQNRLAAYYGTTDHHDRDRIAREIHDSVMRQLLNAGIEEEKLVGLDPSSTDKFFLWHTWFADVFNNGGFDIVIGNPPYIQLQGLLGKLYEHQSFKTFNKRGDIYCLFYELGVTILKPNGTLCYITSNKWMKADYGKLLRTFFSDNVNIKYLIDFGSNQIFDNATVDTNILLLNKETNEHCSKAVLVENDKSILASFSKYVTANFCETDFTGNDSWALLTPIQRSILSKVNSSGKMLKDSDIQISYGIKTGCNDAFVISGEVKDSIISACKTVEERELTKSLILPILRGKDVKRYRFDDTQDLWLIFAYYGSHKIIPDELPSIYQHLCKYRDVLENRGQCRYTANGKPNNNAEYPGQHHWLELDNNPAKDKLDDFNKDKIVYREISTAMDAALLPAGWSMNNKVYYIIGENLHYVLSYLNSAVFNKVILQLANTTGGKGPGFLGKIYIPTPCESDLSFISENFGNDEVIDNFFFQKLKLSQQEINWIINEQA